MCSPGCLQTPADTASRQAHRERHHTRSLWGHEDVWHCEQTAPTPPKLLPGATAIQVVHTLCHVACELDVGLLIVPHWHHLGLQPCQALSAGSLGSCCQPTSASRSELAAARTWTCTATAAQTHLVQQDVCRHQHRVGQQPGAHILALHKAMLVRLAPVLLAVAQAAASCSSAHLADRLLLELRHLAQPPQRRRAGQQPGQLCVCRHVGLHEDARALWVHTRRNIQGC